MVQKYGMVKPKVKVTKPNISKRSVSIKKVDKPRTAMSMLKKEEKGIKNRDIEIGKPYENTRRYNRDNELKANREKQAAVQKVIDSRTKANNKGLSKSLGAAASNKGMKKADIQGTYNAQKVRKIDHYNESRGGTSTYHLKEYQKALNAQKQMKSIEKTAKKQGVKLKK